MSETLNGRPTANFWIIAGVALIWNLIGLTFYYLEVTATSEALSTLTEAQQKFLATKPLWATSAYGIAVSAGVLGSLFLLLRKDWAVMMFGASLAGVVLQNLHAFLVAGGLDVWGPTGLILPTIVLIIAIALFLFSRYARERGWLG
jgi:hypothetical protein